MKYSFFIYTVSNDQQVSDTKMKEILFVEKIVNSTDVYVVKYIIIKQMLAYVTFRVYVNIKLPSMDKSHINGKLTDFL